MIKTYSRYGAVLAVIIVGSLIFSNSAQGATIGLTTPGSLSGSGANNLAASRFTMPNENGTLTSMSMYLTTTAAAPNNQIQMAVYADGGGVPAGLVASSATQAVVANSWNTISISGTLNANTAYWLAFNTNGANNASYNTSAAGASYYHAQTFGTMPSSFGAGSASATQFAIYATYTSTGAPPPDTTAPTVSISSPSNGSTQTGIISLTASASDNVGVVGVQFKMDGTNLDPEDTTSPYSYTWNSASVANGTHSITAVARDNAGNSTTSTAVSITVNNTVTQPGSWTPPVGIPYPGDWFLATTGSIQNVTTGGTAVTFNGTGTASAPVIFQGVGSPNFTGLVTISGSYVIVDSIVVSGGGVVRFSGDHLELRNSEVTGNNRSISSLAVNVGGSSNIVIYKNLIHDNGDWQSTTENDMHGVGGGGVTSQIWIIENESYHNGGDSVQFGHNGGNQVTNVYIGRNIMHHDRENAVDIKEASNFVVSENTMYGYRQTSTSEGAAVVVHYCPINASIINNDIYDSQIGISSSSLTTACNGVNPVTRFMGNKIHDILANGVQVWGSGKITNMVGNTLYNIAGTGADVSNASSGSTIENNIFSTVTGSDIVIAPSGSITPRNNLADTTNPMFVNAAAGDFHLQSASPAINAGAVSGAYSTFQSVFGTSAAYDLDKVARPQGTAWDIGAYEYTGGGTPTNYTLTVSKAGTGTGTVTGTGINCGTDCSETVSSGTSITLSASANSGSSFAGWSGGGCSGTGSCTVTLSANTTVTATFNTTSPTNQVPVGNFDEIRLSDGVIRGWTYDPDTSSTSNTVQIYINGPVGSGTLMASYATDILRSDVNSAYSITGNHGIEYSIPSQYRDGVTHSVYLYGIDTSNSGISTLLTGSPRSFSLSSTPPASGDLYVDGQITSASCTTYNPSTRSCSGGSNRAYQTMNGASAAAIAGNTVYIRGGTYGAQFAPSTSGSAGNYITYKNYPGETPTINGVTTQAILAIARSYLVIEGLTVTNVASYGRLEDSTNIIIRNNTFSNSTGTGTTSGFKLLRGDHHQIVGNNISGGGDSMTVIDSNYNLFLNNTYGPAGHSELTIRCGNYNVIRGNTFGNPTQKSGEVYDCEQSSSDAPFKLDSAHGNIWEDNKFTATAAAAATNDYQGIQFAGQQGIARRNLFYDNLGGGMGIAVYPDEATYNYQNRIYNNTFYNNRCFAIVGANDVTPSTFYDDQVKNNLMYQNFDCSGGGTAQNQILNTTAVVLTNNMVTTTNPQFVNATSRDLHLQSSSPAIDAGGFLTTTTSAGSGTSMPVADSRYFYEGYSSIAGEVGDTIQLSGSTQTARIVAINRSTNTLTLNTSLTWSSGQGVSLAYSGSAPDAGAYEYQGSVPTNQVPAGTFDEIRLSDGVIRGWTYDPDASSTSNNVQIYINGPMGSGTQIFSGPTTIVRSDVNSTFGISGNHGFEVAIPGQYKDGVSHAVYVYGIDTSNSSISTHLSGSPKSFTLSSATPIAGDINGDHIVNSIDYSIMNSDWFTSNPRSDLNSDGIVNAIDFSILNQNWFKTW